MVDILKTLTIKVFHIKSVILDKVFKIEKNSLVIDSTLDITNYDDLATVEIKVLAPHVRDVQVNTILDVIPVSTKVYGMLGEGVTNTLCGVYVLLTSCQENGTQYFNFGSCNGNLKEIVVQEQVGTFSDNDYLIHIDIKTVNDPDDARKTIYNVHKACDEYIQSMRDVLKKIDGTACVESHTYHEKNNKNGKKVVLIKQIGGQGAMHDNLLLPSEPSGVMDAYSIMEMKNMPVVISPNEYRDGAIRAMT